VSADPPDLEDVTDQAQRINLMWKSHKAHAAWEKALADWVALHAFARRTAWCFTRVAAGLVAVASAMAIFKGAWDVVAPLLKP
jgi:hypothetical protein